MHPVTSTRALEQVVRTGVPPFPPKNLKILLRNLSFDADRCVVMRGSKAIDLTARENALLIEMLKMPHRYISARTLARRLAPTSAYPIEEHSIQQSISTLRRKLGEDGNTQQLLRTKRGLGYGIFPSEHYGSSAV